MPQQVFVSADGFVRVVESGPVGPQGPQGLPGDMGPRTPTAHAVTHATEGTDVLTPGDIGAASLGANTFVAPQVINVDLPINPAVIALEQYRNNGQAVYQLSGTLFDVGGVGTGPYLPIITPSWVEHGFDGLPTGRIVSLSYVTTGVDLSATNLNTNETVPMPFRVGYNSAGGDDKDAVPRAVFNQALARIAALEAKTGGV